MVRNDSVIYAKGFGVQKTGANVPVNDQTLFEIGSSSNRSSPHWSPCS
jgi:CubicO group peptidase (beta-lactamase class C family)